MDQSQPSDEAAMHVSRLTPAATSAGLFVEPGQPDYPCFNAANANTSTDMASDVGREVSTMQAVADASSDLSDAPLSPSAAVTFADAPEMMEIDNPISTNGAQHLAVGYAHSESASDDQIPQHDGASDGAPPAKNKRRTVSVTNASTKKKRAKKDDWSAEHVLQNESSALAFCDLKSILAHPDAFTSLNLEQQEHLLSMLPNQNPTIMGEDGRRIIDPIFLKSDIDWRHAVSRLQEDIAEGRYDPDWLRQAITAFEQRKIGAFDSYKDQEFEEFWGIKQKLPHNVIAGITSAIKWETLFNSNILQIGDILVHKRNHRLGKTTVTIEKEAKVIKDGSEPRSKGYPTISFPPGEHKMSNPDLREDVVLHHVAGPEQLVRAITNEDGRLQNISNGNGWKSIRVIRKNQDLGSLWDIRQAYHFSQNEGDYKSILSHIRNHSHRASRAQQEHGFYWVNPLQILVKKIHISDLPKQHPNEVLPICDDLAKSFTKIAHPGYTFVKCDPRIFRDDGIPFPRSDTLTYAQSLQRILSLGPAAFPTAYTRELAGRYGWSFGHAHLGALALNFSLRSVCSPIYAKTVFVEGYLDRALLLIAKGNVNIAPDKNLLLTNEEKWHLKTLFESDKRFTTQDEQDLLAHFGFGSTEFLQGIGDVSDHLKDYPKSAFSYGHAPFPTPHHAISGVFPYQVQIVDTSSGSLYDQECCSDTDPEQHEGDKFNPPQFHAEHFGITELPGPKFLWNCFNMRNTSFISDYPAASSFSGLVLSRLSSVMGITSNYSSSPGESEAHERCLLQDHCECPQIPASPSYEVQLVQHYGMASPYCNPDHINPPGMSAPEKRFDST